MMPKDHVEIIHDLGGPTAVAGRMKLKPARVRMWKLRGRLPRSIWPEIIEAYPELSLEQLRAAEPA